MMHRLKDLDLTSKKARQIMDGARQAFMELGYEATSVDEIARRAGVSKGTLYSYFADKETMFAAFVHEVCQEQASRTFTIDPNVDDLRETLLTVARGFVSFLVSPFALRVFRVVVAEAERFPSMAQTFYESGPELGTSRLSEFLEARVAAGDLDIADIDLAAQQFIELCKADLFYKRMLAIRARVRGEEIDRIAAGAVDMFLRAYAARR